MVNSFPQKSVAPTCTRACGACHSAEQGKVKNLKDNFDGKMHPQGDPTLQGQAALRSLVIPWPAP
ncbi:hypothetical protein GCM10023333_36910 [Ferrimonas pelagia]|uniref:Uncharacterized protein n=1 Tax=Ferrimonas pelagia TaxID=1177826 RepID=A0ABP9FMR6_9GAMM